MLQESLCTYRMSSLRCAALISNSLNVVSKFHTRMWMGKGAGCWMCLSFLILLLLLRYTEVQRRVLVDVATELYICQIYISDIYIFMHQIYMSGSQDNRNCYLSEYPIQHIVGQDVGNIYLSEHGYSTPWNKCS